MDVGVSGGKENVGDKVVLHSGVDLNDVASLATNVEVVDGDILELSGTRADGKGV